MKKNYMDEIMTKDFDMSEVKIYPGSAKGPLPEDDPKGYSKWFAENQPKKAFEGYLEGGKHTFSEFGVKSKVKPLVKENVNSIEILSTAVAIAED